MVAQPFSLTTSAANLRRLAMIRLILITALIAGFIYLKYATQSDLINPTHLTMLALFALVTMLTYWRLQQPWPVTDLEYFTHLLFDILGLTVVLYASGGASNPFVSYFLVPITISAALLPWRYTWLIALLSLTAYTFLLFYHQPLPHLTPSQGGHSGHQPAGINLHILGMWLTFALSTALITYFVVKMANALRQQQQLQASYREDDLRDEQILAVATLAAGTAHELGTPLSTMLVLLDELIETTSDNNVDKAQLREDYQLLKKQVESCKQILKELVNTAEIRSHQERRPAYISDYFDTLLEHWQVMRPEVRLKVELSPQLQQQQLLVEPTLEQAIGNLLNNAADANREQGGSHPVELKLYRQEAQLFIEIRDFGRGIPMEVAEHLGKPFVSTKGKGLGLGLFLSHATIDRYGGKITLHNHPEGGTVAELQLPLVISGEADV